MARTEHGRRHLLFECIGKPGVSPSELAPCLEHLQHTISLSPPPNLPCILSHTFSQNPTGKTMVGVSSISKVFVVVGF